MQFVSRKKLLFVFTALMSGIVVKEVLSFASGAPPGFTGSYADGGSTCVTCHTGTTATPVPGWITSNIPPFGYIPGNTYTISAQVVMNGHVRFGFEISPMDSFGSVIGSMTDITAETEVIGSGVYITHSFIGTGGLNSKTWIFDWTAPLPGVGNVIFYGAFNVADDNGSNSLDTIFTSTYTVQENTSIGYEELVWMNECRIYPNPVTDLVTMRFNTLSAKKVTVSLYDPKGDLVISNRMLKTDAGGNVYLKLPEGLLQGLYFLKILDAQREISKKIIVLNEIR